MIRFSRVVQRFFWDSLRLIEMLEGLERFDSFFYLRGTFKNFVGISSFGFFNFQVLGNSMSVALTDNLGSFQFSLLTFTSIWGDFSRFLNILEDSWWFLEEVSGGWGWLKDC